MWIQDQSICIFWVWFWMFYFQSSREQLAIGAFAQSLLVIPNTLAVNAAKDSTDLVPKLRAYHHSSQVKTEHAQLKFYGLDLMKGKKILLFFFILRILSNFCV